MQLRVRSSQHPIQILILLFTAWKLLLLLVVACSPGPGYDTSTSLSLSGTIENGKLPTPVDYMIGKLTRWDAIYFVKVSNRGYLYEQEWAWGWGFTHLLKFCTGAIVNSGFTHSEGLEGLVGIVIAHLAHLLSVLALFSLTEAIFSASSSLPLAASFLHIISPAGIFLSAPYAESPCALLSFLGCLLFTKSLGSGNQSTSGQDVLVLLSGILFGVATTFRSNGILNGLLLLEEAFRVLFLFKRGFELTAVRRLVATGVGGLAVAAGFLLPQYIAYNEYCSITPSRSWCESRLPSIYTFVQEHYWNVGLFRYWTLSNVPLFLLATPVTFIMGISGQWALRYKGIIGTEKKRGSDQPSVVQVQVLRNLAVSQLALTTLTLTTAHVQIITRLASAYPVWLWYLASSCKESSLFGKTFVLFMMMYGLIQAGLFASFLPPA